VHRLAYGVDAQVVPEELQTRARSDDALGVAVLVGTLWRIGNNH
jgi:hypothetical protein